MLNSILFLPHAAIHSLDLAHCIIAPPPRYRSHSDPALLSDSSTRHAGSNLLHHLNGRHHIGNNRHRPLAKSARHKISGRSSLTPRTLSSRSISTRTTTTSSLRSNSSRTPTRTPSTSRTTFDSSMPHTPSTPGSSSHRFRHSYHDHDPDQYHEQFHDLHRDLLLHRDFVQIQHELLQQQQSQSQLQIAEQRQNLPAQQTNYHQQLTFSHENLANDQQSQPPSTQQSAQQQQSLPPPPPPPAALHADRDLFYDPRGRSATLPASLPSEYSNFSNYSNLAALNIAAHPNFFSATSGAANASTTDYRAATLPASLSPRHVLPRQLSPRQSLARPGSAAALCDYPPRMRGAHMRISDSSLEVGRNSVRQQQGLATASPPPGLRSPYSCLLLSNTAGTPGAPTQVFASPLQVPLDAPPSPCLPGCACNPSSGSASSLAGGSSCPIHGGKVFTTSRSTHHPPPPPPRSGGHGYPDSDVDLGGSRALADSGDDCHLWRSKGDNTSEDLKEESVRELLLRCVSLLSFLSVWRKAFLF